MASTSSGAHDNMAHTFKYLMGLSLSLWLSFYLRSFTSDCTFWLTVIFQRRNFCPEESLLCSIHGLLGTSLKLTMRLSLQVWPFCFPNLHCLNLILKFTICLYWWVSFTYPFQLYAVQFQLFVTCVLFLSREGFRRACMRTEVPRYSFY